MAAILPLRLFMTEAVLSLEAGWDMRPAPIPAPAMPEAKQRAAMDMLLRLESGEQCDAHAHREWLSKMKGGCARDGECVGRQVG